MLVFLLVISGNIVVLCPYFFAVFAHALHKILPTQQQSERAYYYSPIIRVDSVSPRMSTIAPRDQFKPIRIGENLEVNYN